MEKKAIRNKIRRVKDFPEKGVNFLDITPALRDRACFRDAINLMAAMVRNEKIDKIVGLDARGFIFASALAYKLGTGLVIARKKGKLPCRTVACDYGLEYGKATLEIHADAIAEGERVLVVDDILATGGTAAAAGELVRRLGGVLAGMLFFAGISGLEGRKKLNGINVKTLLTF